MAFSVAVNNLHLLLGERVHALRHDLFLLPVVILRRGTLTTSCMCGGHVGRPPCCVDHFYSLVHVMYGVA